MAAEQFYQLSCKDIKGKDFSFESLRGKVVIVVNVASKCGFTKQYKGLEELYQKFKDQGLQIIGFPCNQFGGQEPGSAEEIESFCSLNYNVSFPIMEKVDVNGSDAHPVYKYLKHERKNLMMELIKWNFEKFLVDTNGNVVERYSSIAEPSSMEAAVAKLLPTASA